MRIIPDATGAGDADNRLEAPTERPAKALDDALARIGERYGAGTANPVVMQLEHPRAEQGATHAPLPPASPGRSAGVGRD